MNFSYWPTCIHPAHHIDVHLLSYRQLQLAYIRVFFPAYRCLAASLRTKNYCLRVRCLREKEVQMWVGNASLRRAMGVIIYYSTFSRSERNFRFVLVNGAKQCANLGYVRVVVVLSQIE